MLKQNRALNVAQYAIAEVWESGNCNKAQQFAVKEEMKLKCRKISYGAQIKLEWFSGKDVQRLEIN